MSINIEIYLSKIWIFGGKKNHKAGYVSDSYITCKAIRMYELCPGCLVHELGDRVLPLNFLVVLWSNWPLTT